MNNILVGKPIAGITLNGLEYLMAENGTPLSFPNLEQAHAFLQKRGLTKDEIEELSFVGEAESTPFMPSDETLNLAMAMLCGWKQQIEDSGAVWYRKAVRQKSPPDYCHDRNAHSEILSLIEAKGKGKIYAAILLSLVTEGLPSVAPLQHHFNAWRMLKASPRLYVEAALHTLNQWQDTWSTHKKSQ